MIEDSENLVTVKVFPADREWIKDEQQRLRKQRGGKEPTHGEIVRALIARAGKAVGPEMPKASSYRSDNKKWHDMLEIILNDGTDDDRRGIEQNLKWAVESIERRAPKRKRAG